MKAVNLGVLKYAPDTRLSFTLKSEDAYDLSTVSVGFEVKVNDDVLVINDDDDNITISDQNIVVTISPLATDGTFVFGTFIAQKPSVPFNLDLYQTGSSIVDWRIQGEILNLPEHGQF